MAERPTSHSLTHVEFHWSASRASNSRRATVEDVSDESEEATSNIPGSFEEPETGRSGRERDRRGETIPHDADPSLRKPRNKQRSMSTDDLSIHRADKSRGPSLAARSGWGSASLGPGELSARCMVDGKQEMGEKDLHTVKTSSPEPLVSNDIPSGVTAKQGHSYRGVRVSEHARMHAGDMYNFFHVSFQGPRFATDGAQRRPPTYDNEAVKVCLGACAMLLAFLGALEQVFLLVQCSIQQSMVEPSLPEQITLETATFEDALGVKVIIDLKFIGDWESFQSLLHRSFVDRKGSQRVARSGYRLFRQSRSDQLYHPKALPSFSSVFSPGEDVRMSLHFEWYEVADMQCPRCGLESDQDTTDEILCARCNFLYRSQVRDFGDIAKPFEFLDESQQDNSERRPSHGPARDIPGHFHRISISAQDELRPEPILQNYISLLSDLDSSMSTALFEERVKHWVEDIAISPQHTVSKPDSEDDGHGNEPNRHRS